MGRSIGSAVAGYLVVFATIFGAMTAAWFALGENGTFRPGVWELTNSWIVISSAVALGAGALGGLVTAKLARDTRGLKILAGLIVVIGVLLALPILTGSHPQAPLPRATGLPMFQAMANGQPPAWLVLLNPLLSASAALLAGRRRA
jgi:hypothetical protein